MPAVPKAPKRIEDKAHLAFIATLTCCVCGLSPVQVHHLLRTGEHGMGRKSGDDKVLPVCPECHRKLHLDGNETRFLRMHGINGRALGGLLWANTGDRTAGLGIIMRARI